MSEFSEQYKHPQWQKRRLEILSACGFECEHCGDTESTIHVHHKHYVKGRKVWEYEYLELSALCENCHDAAHILKNRISDALARLDTLELEYTLGYALGLFIRREQDSNDDLRVRVDSWEIAVGLCAANCGHPAYKIDRFCPDGGWFSVDDLKTISEL